MIHLIRFSYYGTIHAPTMAEVSMTTIYVIIGILLLLAGRRALWLSIMGVVFVAANQLLHHFLFDLSAATVTLMAAGISLAALVLYLLLEKAALFILGAIGGGITGVFTVNSLIAFNMDPLVLSTIAFLLGGVIGLLLVHWLFQWAMVVLSTLMGAYLVSGSINHLPLFRLTAMAMLVIAGLIIQTRLLRAKKPEQNLPFDSYQTAD